MNSGHIIISLYLTYPNKKIILRVKLIDWKLYLVLPLADYIAYALVLTPNLKSISSDGQRSSDLICEINLKIKILDNHIL